MPHTANTPRMGRSCSVRANSTESPSVRTKAFDSPVMMVVLIDQRV